VRRALGVELAGYLDAALGVGEHARRYMEALRLAGVRVSARDVHLDGRDSVAIALPRARHRWARQPAFNLLCMNPEQLLPYLESDGAPPLRGRTSIGVWTWEVDVLPPGWTEAASRLTEIWTNSQFAAQIIATGTGARALAFPPPLSASMLADPPRTGTDGPFTALVVFDYLSTLERKNPLGAIEAYRRAFDQGDGARLIVKSMNAVHRPRARAEIEDAVGGRRDVELRDGTVSTAERDALIGSCDCLISLHRSEGFGMSLAEAMAAGKSVVATGYGGNTEFMDSDNSYLVRFVPALVGEGVEHYPRGAAWAEPDVGHAAELLREVFEQPARARERAALGRADVRSRLAPQRVGDSMAARLRELA
jgi:glycosyltransferase involved in cell wall biosynthesis